MKKAIMTVVTVLMVVTNVQAQTKKWTLDECIDYAVKHNIGMEQSRNSIESLKVTRSTLKNSFLPNLSAGASQKFAFGRSLNQDNVYEDSNIQSTVFSVGMEVSLFSGFHTTASIAQNKYELLAAEADRELIKNNLALNVAAAYFQILLDKEICRIAREQIELTQGQVERTRLLIENGRAAESMLYDVKAQLADDELTETEARNSLRLSMLDLAQLMELQEGEAFEVDTIAGEMDRPDTLSPLRIYNAAECCMPQVKRAHYTLESKIKGIKAAQSGYYPSVTLGAGISSGYYYYGKGLSETFRRQVDNNMQKSIYVSVSIPLFDRFSTRNQVRAARIEASQARLSLENEKKGLYKDIEKAYADALSAYEKYRSTCKAVAANREAHRYALEKYAAGKSSVFEYNEIKLKLADALSKQSQAKYTCLLKERVLRFYACHALME